MDTIGDQNLQFIGEGDSIRLQKCNGSTKRGADGRTYSEHSRSPSYIRIELGLRTKYCAFWSGGQVAQW